MKIKVSREVIKGIVNRNCYFDANCKLKVTSAMEHPSAKIHAQ